MLAKKYFKGKKKKKASAFQKIKRKYRGFVPEVVVNTIRKIRN